MSRIIEQQAIQRIPELIAGWLDADIGEVHPDYPINGHRIDLLQRTGGYTFAVECKATGTVTAVSDAIRALRQSLNYLNENTIPIVAVPFMGNAGRALCAQEQMSWLDLSGNAHIAAHHLRILIEGKPNQFKSLGRPKDLFAPKSSRIARLLLTNINHSFTQRELSITANIDEALVSRVVRQFEKDGLIVRDKTGAIKPGDPNLLLDAWHEAYSFKKHTIIPGFVAERTSDTVLKNMSSFFKTNNVKYAATGLAAAWLLTHFAIFRITTFYIEEMPQQKLLEQLHFKEQSKGGNVWLVVPNDEGVFDQASEREGIWCVHPVQVYLDLKGHPERAKEASTAIRHEYLSWSDHA